MFLRPVKLIAATLLLSFLFCPILYATWPGEEGKNGDIVYVEDCSPLNGSPKVKIINVETGTIRNFPIFGRSPQFSPDGRKIVYMSGTRINSTSSIRIANRDGTGSKSIGKSGMYPRWSPDGKKLTYSRSGDIFVYNLETETETQITDNDFPTTDKDPVWGPNDRIVFVRNFFNPSPPAEKNNEKQHLDLFVVNPDGSGLANITDPELLDEGIDQRPDFHPTDDIVLFMRGVHGGPSGNDIYAGSSGGAEPTPVLILSEDTPGQVDTHPVFSPDGKMIAFAKRTSNNYQLFIANSDGSGQQQLTQDSPRVCEMAWAPLVADASFEVSKAPGAFWGSSVNGVFAKSTIKYRGAGWDPEGDEIQILFAGEEIARLPAQSSFEEEFMVEMFPKTSTRDERRGIRACAAALVAKQGSTALEVEVLGQKAEEIQAAAQIVNLKGEGLGGNDYLCAGEHMYPKDGLASNVKFVGVDDFPPELAFSPEQNDPTFIAPNPALTGPHLVVTIPVIEGGRSLGDNDIERLIKVGRYKGAWLQFRGRDGSYIDLMEIFFNTIVFDGLVIFRANRYINLQQNLRLSPDGYGRPRGPSTAATAGNVLVVTTTPPSANDNDSDGIENDVDGNQSGSGSFLRVANLATDFSDEFIDPTGVTFGRILDRFDQTVRVRQVPSAPGVIEIEALGDKAEERAAVVAVCGLTVFLVSGDKVQVSCATNSLRVVEGGPIFLNIGADIITRIPKGQAIIVDSTAGETFDITADASNSAAISVIKIGEPTESLDAGQSVSLQSAKDGDFDGVADTLDECPSDFYKAIAGVCGCGKSDADSDADEVVNCNDACPFNSALSQPGVCGCGTVVSVLDKNYCDDNGSIVSGLNRLVELLKQLKKAKNKKATKNRDNFQKQVILSLRKLTNGVVNFATSDSATVSVSNKKFNLAKKMKQMAKLVKKALKRKSPRFSKNKKRAIRAARKVVKQVAPI